MRDHVDVHLARQGPTLSYKARGTLGPVLLSNNTSLVYIVQPLGQKHYCCSATPSSVQVMVEIIQHTRLCSISLGFEDSKPTNAYGDVL